MEVDDKTLYPKDVQDFLQEMKGKATVHNKKLLTVVLDVIHLFGFIDKSE